MKNHVPVPILNAKPFFFLGKKKQKTFLILAFAIRQREQHSDVAPYGQELISVFIPSRPRREFIK